MITLNRLNILIDLILTGLMHSGVMLFSGFIAFHNGIISPFDKVIFLLCALLIYANLLMLLSKVRYAIKQFKSNKYEGL